MCLILFTPFITSNNYKLMKNNHFIEIAHNNKYGINVPDLSFKKKDITDILHKHNCKYNIKPS